MNFLQIAIIIIPAIGFGCYLGDVLKEGQK